MATFLIVVACLLFVPLVLWLLTRAVAAIAVGFVVAMFFDAFNKR